MRGLKLGLLSGFVALVAFGSVDSAEAGSKWKWRYYDYYPEYESFYPGPIFIPPPRYLRKYNRYSAYEDEYDDFDPDYYEPRYAPPGPPKKKVKKPQQTPQASKPSTTTTTKKAATTTKKPQTQQQAQKKPTSITCDKASSIVAGYGFSSVKPSTCEGKEYAFAATRDGANYVIKMSSANGELTQVKKQ
ncbi:MAG: hypothetical protein JNM20_11305 [Rhizobiales bacterium]|nr:hypothetical protein [Hyphomicrobiales bacterium]